MKKKDRYRYSRGIIGIPTVFVCLLSVGMWFLWPSEHPPRLRPRAPMPPVFAYTVSSVPISLGTFDGRGVKKPTSKRIGMPGTLYAHRVVTPKILTTKPMMSAKYVSEQDSALVAVPDYEPVIDDVSAFTDKVLASSRLKVEPAGKLKELGFHVPDLVPESFESTESSWRIRFFVELDETGVPEHVFIENGCGNRDVNALVMKKLYRGVLSGDKEECSGRVTVTYDWASKAE